MNIKKRTVYSGEGFDFTFEPIERSLSVKKTKTGFEVKYLTYSSNPDDPRNWNNFSTMVCFHNRYALGDEHNYKDYEDFLLSLAVELNFISSKDNESNYTIQELFEEIERKMVIIPLYLYDHSGISIRTYRHGQHASWDCGQVGYIFVDYSTIKEELNVKKITKKIEEQARGILETEVDTYNKYVMGEVYTIVKETYDKNKEQIDYDCVDGYFGIEESLKVLKTDI